jgi:L-methionine (R)-S-oxide reductase
MELKRSVDYELLDRQVRELVSGERDHLANAANFAALLFQEIPDVSWAGFYYVDSAGDLVLGPFGGKPACARLAAGSGVCGAAFTSRRTVVVDDVNSFSGHITCDVDARSELVVPLVSADRCYGVFDLDSVRPARFGAGDRAGIEALVRSFCEHVAPPRWHEGTKGTPSS